jgi:hypothetical protein
MFTSSDVPAMTKNQMDRAPENTSDGGGDRATIEIAEGELDVTTVTASQHSNGRLFYSIDAADAALFEINSKTGRLRFRSTPAAGSYEVVVTVTGRGGLTDTQTITVTVEEAEGGYTAQAVHFDGGVCLEIASLTSTDNHFFSAVGWVKIPANLVDISTGVVRFYSIDPDVSDGFSGVSVQNGVDPPPFELSFEVTDDGDNHDEEIGGPNSGTVFSAGVWQCFIASIDTSDVNIGKVYLGDTDTGLICRFSDGASPPFVISSNGKKFVFGADRVGSPQRRALIGDVADWRIMPGVSLLTAGDITETTRRLFIDADGKPVDPAVATAALGAPATVLFSRTDSNPLTFADNEGTGGTATVVLIDLTGYPDGGGVGHNGPGAIPYAAAFVGQTVVSVHDLNNDIDVSADFESVISVTGQIQQTGVADYSAISLQIVRTSAGLTNSTTSPSD